MIFFCKFVKTTFILTHILHCIQTQDHINLESKISIPKFSFSLKDLNSQNLKGPMTIGHDREGFFSQKVTFSEDSQSDLIRHDQNIQVQPVQVSTESIYHSRNMEGPRTTGHELDPGEESQSNLFSRDLDIQVQPVSMVNANSIYHTLKDPRTPGHESDLEDFFSQKVPLSEDPFFLIGNSTPLLENCTNCSATAPLHAPQFQRSTLVKGLVLCVIALLSLAGNIGTLISILRTGRQGSSTVYMLLKQVRIKNNF